MDKLTTVTHALLDFQVSLKLYHWQTTIFARHSATDKLFESISTLVDTFVEAFQGSKNKRIHFQEDCVIHLKNFGDNDGKKLLLNFKSWLETELPVYLTDKDSELMNLRDEMLSEVKKTLYLFTMK